MRILFIVCLLTLPGCASILSDSRYPIEIKSNPSQAYYSITDRRGNLIHEGVTPETITLESGTGYFDRAEYKVLFWKKGYHKEIREVKSEVDGFYFANIANLFGLFAVDPSGSMYELPDSVHVFLKELLVQTPPVVQCYPSTYRSPAVTPAPEPLQTVPIPSNVGRVTVERIVEPVHKVTTTESIDQVTTIRQEVEKPCNKEEPQNCVME